MKQAYGIIGIIGVFILLLGAVGVYAYSSNAGRGMMGNPQGTYRGMMNGNTNYRSMMNGNSGNYRWMMTNFDNDKIQQMNEMHDQMIENLDPITARQMDAMHDAYIGNNDGNEQ